MHVNFVFYGYPATSERVLCKPASFFVKLIIRLSRQCCFLFFLSFALLDVCAPVHHFLPGTGLKGGSRSCHHAVDGV
jgi:hypothetical protein